MHIKGRGVIHSTRHTAVIHLTPTVLPIKLLNPLIPNRYNCTYVLFLVEGPIVVKRTVTLLTHKSLKHTIVSIESDHFLYK